MKVKYRIDDIMVDEFGLAKEDLAKTIIGEIVLSDNPNGVIKKWRNIFKVSQKRLANELGITSSVVSDYESGRRKSPGIKVIKNYIDALLRIDERRGGQIIRSFIKSTHSTPISNAIVSIKEFSEGVDVEDFCNIINAIPIVKTEGMYQKIYGYTIIDSVKAILELSFSELIKLYGITTQRALIFTNVSRGRSPMVAIKVTNLKPSLVVFHGLDVVDELAKSIAKVESIPLAVCRLENVEDIVRNLENFK